jgi:hypothetical protein
VPMRVIAKKRCRVMVEPSEKGERAALNPNLSTGLNPARPSCTTHACTSTDRTISSGHGKRRLARLIGYFKCPSNRMSAWAK